MKRILGLLVLVCTLNGCVAMATGYMAGRMARDRWDAKQTADIQRQTGQTAQAPIVQK